MNARDIILLTIGVVIGVYITTFVFVSYLPQQLTPTVHWCTSATEPVYETLNGPQSDFVLILLMCAGIGTILCGALWLSHGEEK